MNKILPLVLLCCFTLSCSFGFLDVYLGDATTVTYNKKPSAINIGLETKYVNLKNADSIIKADSNLIMGGVIIALNTNDFSKFGLSVAGGVNQNTRVSNVALDFTVKFPLLIFLSEVDLISGANFGVTTVEQNNQHDTYGTFEPKLGLGFNFNQNFSVNTMLSLIYNELIQSQTASPQKEAFNTAFSVVFKLSML